MSGYFVPTPTVPVEVGYSVGWVILSLLLMVAIIVLIILYAFALNNNQNTLTGVCFGPFGVETGVDADPVNLCGTGQSDPCIFPQNSISGCELQCNTLSSICSAFTFNSSTATMKIVRPTNTYISPSTDLFVRQVGQIS